MEFAVPALKVPEVSYSAIALELSSILTAYSQADEFSGVVLLRQGDQDLLKAAYGYANRTWGLRNQPDTRFRIASISKLFTAIAILQLIERGQLDWNTAVAKPLGLKDTQIPEAVTVYHLLTMTAGIADWFEESGDWAEDWAALCREHPLYLLRRNADYLPLFATKPPGSAVGERYQYNNASYILLGQLIEQVTGLSYFDYVRRHIFTPAQMTQSDFVALDAIHPPVAEGYIPVLNEQAAAAWQKNIYAVTPEAAADGGAVSTVDDLSRFVRSLLAGQLLSPKMTQAMLTPQVLEATDDDYLWHYGFGNQFLLNRAGQVLRWGHTGEEEGVSCRLYYYPQADLQVVILGNQSECAGPLGWEIHDLLAATFKP